MTTYIFYSNQSDKTKKCILIGFSWDPLESAPPYVYIYIYTQQDATQGQCLNGI